MLLRELARRAGRSSPDMAARYFDEGDVSNDPRLAVELVEALTRHHYEEHARELNTLLWEALTKSASDTVALPNALADRLEAARNIKPSAHQDKDLALALASHGGNITRTAEALGMSRHALRRLLKKRGLAAGE